MPDYLAEVANYAAAFDVETLWDWAMSLVSVLGPVYGADLVYSKWNIGNVEETFSENYKEALEEDTREAQIQAMQDAYEQRLEDLEDIWCLPAMVVTYKAKNRQRGKVSDMMAILDRLETAVEEGADEAKLDAIYQELREAEDD